MGAIGVMGSSCNSLSSLLHELHFDKTITKRIIVKAMNISVRSSFYIFCHRNKPWTNPELLLFHIPSFYSFTSAVFVSFYIVCYALYKQANSTLPYA